MCGRPLRPTVPKVWGRSRSVRRLEKDEKVGRGWDLRGESSRGCGAGGEPGVAGAGGWGVGSEQEWLRCRGVGLQVLEGREVEVVGRSSGCGRARVGPCGRRSGAEHVLGLCFPCSSPET